MTTLPEQTSLIELGIAFNQLVKAAPDEQTNALENFCQSILHRYNYTFSSTAVDELFSRELPDEIQRFTAVWVLRVLIESPTASRSGDMERLVVTLFDRGLHRDLYQRLHIEDKMQTFEKIQFLTRWAISILDEANDLLLFTSHLDQVNTLKQRFLALVNGRNRPFLLPLLPRTLIGDARISDLFRAVTDYVNNSDQDPIHLRDIACDACDLFESESRAFGTTDSDHLLGELARRLKSTMLEHFESSEGSKYPDLDFRPIEKQYALGRTGTSIIIKIRILNHGTGPARDFMLQEVVCDDSIEIHTSPMHLGTIQAADSFVLDILATVIKPTSQVKLLLDFSWQSSGREERVTPELLVLGQREDIDWDKVEFTEPYSLEAVTTGTDLIGRKNELTRLIRLTNNRTVGSGYIYGQKRVGKTSLANAVTEALESDTDVHWVVVSKGSGDYLANDAISTLHNLGSVLVQALKQQIPHLGSILVPDFSNGLAPLSGVIDQALVDSNLRILFILDEFDELPFDLFQRNEIGAALFQSMRQISNKQRCGFLLVGGEGMQQIINRQGDRLNKFRPVEVDYFSKSNDWADFVELIRRPVQDWLTISDEALDKLFEACAGNPYFAKLLASQLFSDMVEHRDSDASEVDLSIAINNALSSVGANSFAHFWIDGVVESSIDAAETHILRRSVLIAAGRVFRKQSNADIESIREEFRTGIGFPFEEQRFRITMQDFIRRKIFTESDDERISAKIPLFQFWLKDRGIGELLADSRELEYLAAKLQDEEDMRVTDDEILDLCKRTARFHYRGHALQSTSIREWLEQFVAPREQRLMFQMLTHIRFYDEHLVRTKMKEAFGIVRRNIHTLIDESRVRSDILVSTFDKSIAKGGSTYCRLFASENQISTQSVLALESLERRFVGNRRIQRLVFIDDFSGSGGTLINGIRDNIDLLRRANAEGIRIIVIALVGFAESRDSIERFVKQSKLDADVYFCDELGLEDRVFSETSTVFDDPTEREQARQIAESKGVKLEPKQPLGYRDTQALVVFHQSCPNNTLPIIWSNNSGWRPLFSRIYA